MVSFGDLIDILKHICPTGPSGRGHGHGHGHGHGGQLPNQLLTSPETVWYIEEAEWYDTSLYLALILCVVIISHIV